MTSARVLGLCGLFASWCSMVGGFFNVPVLLGIGGAVMLLGNIYVSWRG